MSKVVVRAAAVDLQKFRFDQEFQCTNPQICPQVYLAVSGIVSEHQSLESEPPTLPDFRRSIIDWIDHGNKTYTSQIPF